MISIEEDLFKVADLSRLRVLAYAYEEDLPKLDALAPERRKWTISLPADPTLPHQEVSIDRIGHIIDPTQHTALVMGWVDNPQGRLCAGQFLTATVELPPPGNEVALPASALIEKGGEDLVFVQTAPEPIFTLRCVSVSRQVGQTICVRSQPPTAGAFPLAATQRGDVVVVSGAIELQQALADLTAVSAENRSAP